MRHDVDAVDVPLPRTSRTFTDPQWLAPPLGVFSFTGSRYQRIEVSRPPPRRTPAKPPPNLHRHIPDIQNIARIRKKALMTVVTEGSSSFSLSRHAPARRSRKLLDTGAVLIGKGYGQAVVVPGTVRATFIISVIACYMLIKFTPLNWIINGYHKSRFKLSQSR